MSVIKVVADQFGVVTDVVVPPNWREKVHPRDLGQALGAAANAALTGRLAADAPVARRDARDPYGDDLVNELVALLAVFDRDLALYRQELTEAANATATARSTKGTIEVTMAHGRVTEVMVNPGWARSARNTDIRVEALAAFTAAGRQLADMTPARVALPASLARLRELTSDPHALSRQLGLT